MPKAKLPTKTKIAVWLILSFAMIVIITVPVLSSIYVSFQSERWIQDNIVFALGFLGIGSLLFLLKHSWAWTVAVSVIVIAMLDALAGLTKLLIDYIPHYTYYSSHYSYATIMLFVFLLGFFIYLTSLILIILDRKNYFEMVRQRELEKKGNV
jgi:predicted anti-sigma-YlaC factor YlaD